MDLNNKYGKLAHSVVIYDYNIIENDYVFNVYDNALYVESMIYSNGTFVTKYTDYYKNTQEYDPNKYHISCFHTYGTIKSVYDYMYYYNKYNFNDMWGGASILSTSNADKFICII